jgi:hypothetical protein
MREVGPELRLARGTSEVVRRLPDRIVDEYTAAGDAAMELRRDQAWLLSHDRQLLLEAFQEIIDLVGRDQKGVPTLCSSCCLKVTRSSRLTILVP